MDIYSSPLNDDFNRHDGAMVSYLASDRVTPITPRYHYDLRAFHQADQTLPFTQTDYNFWHGYAYNTLAVGDPRPLGGLIGTETWDTSSGTVTVGKDAAYRYSNSIRIVVADSSLSDGVFGGSTYGVGTFGAVVSSVASTSTAQFADNILTDFNNPAHTYYLELVLRSFPAQTDAAHFDLSNSFIDISSSPTFTAGTTNSLAFSSSVSSSNIAAGGDVYLRFNRNLIDRADLTSIRGVRFRMRSVGGTSTLIAQNLRLFALTEYSFQDIDVDTKRQQLTRSAGEWGIEDSGRYGDTYFARQEPKNVTYITQFNSGHAPTGNDNIHQQFFRTQINGDRIEVKLASRNTQSRLTITEKVGIPNILYQSPINSNILTDSTFYYLVVEVVGNQVRASVYNRTGNSIGSLVYTTDWITLATLMSAGLVGYSFEPYNYDFTIQYMAPQSTQFAVFQSTAMNSRKLVRGATLYPVNSKPINILSELTPVAWGDATAAIDGNGDTVVTRTGALTQGGVRYEPLAFIGDSSQLVVSGSLWTSTVQGTYRVAIVDAQDNVQWIGLISGVVANRWNEFSILVAPGLLPETSYLHVQQTGTFAGSFKLRDVELGYNTIAWNISPNGGTSWQPFLQALSLEFSGTAFARATTTITLQGIANTDQGWISGYQLKPQYGGQSIPAGTVALPLLFSTS